MFQFERLSFPEKVQFIKYTKESFSIPETIHLDGFVCAKEEFATTGNGGDHYVYLWKHMFGNPFYVGSGQGKRWTWKHREADFSRHLDKGDSAVYKVLSCVDRETARKFERYITFHLCSMGYVLANKDNNLDKLSDKSIGELIKGVGYRNDKLTEKVESAVCNILIDDRFDGKSVLGTQMFKEKYGDHYFSETLHHK